MEQDRSGSRNGIASRVLSITRLAMILLLPGDFLVNSHDLAAWQRGYILGAMFAFTVVHFLHTRTKTERANLILCGIDFVIAVSFGFVFPYGYPYEVLLGIVGVTFMLETDNRRLIRGWYVLVSIVWLSVQSFDTLVYGKGQWIESLINFGFILFSSSVGYLIRYNQQARAQITHLYHQLGESHQAMQVVNQELNEYAKQVESLTVTRERNNIAREIHDTVGHTMTALIVQLQAARKLQDRDLALSSETLLRCEELARSALQEVRLSVRTLREDDAEPTTITEALRKLLADFSDMTGLQTKLHLQGDPTVVTISLQLTIYRIVQEALTNAKRHGNAATAIVSLQCGEREIRLEIGDDGEGLDEVVPGFGLINMRERVMEQGGTVHFSSERGKGFRVQIQFPLQQQSWRYGGQLA
ncbi:MAG: sensor histidine kinase [Tumebacillaceae bacterium]